MADNEITIKITATTNELISQIDSAKSKVNELKATANELGDMFGIDVAKASNFDHSLNSLQGTLNYTKASTAAAAGEFDLLGGRVKEASAPLMEFAEKTKTASVDTEKFHGSISKIINELFVLVREGSRGNFSRMAGSLSILATQGFGVSLSFLGIGSAAAVLVGGLGYLAYSAIKASEAIQGIVLTGEVANNLYLTKNATDAYAASLENLSQKSGTEVREALEVLASIPNLEKPAFEASVNMLTVWATSHHETLQKAAEDFKKMFGDTSNDVVKYANELGVINPKLLEMARQAELSGNSQAILAAKLALVQFQTQRTTTSVIENKEQIVGADISTGNWFLRLLALQGAGEAAGVGIDLLGEMTKKTAADIQGADAATTKLISDLKELTSEHRILADAERQRKGSTDIERKDQDVALIQLQSQEIDILNNKMQSMRASDQPAAEIESLAHQIDIAKQKIANAQQEMNRIDLGPLVERARAAAEHIAVDWKGSQDQLAAAQVKVLQGYLDSLKAKEVGAKGEAAEEIRLQEMIDQKKIAAQKRDAREGLAMEKSIEAEKLSEIASANATDAVKRLSLQIEYLKSLLDGTRLNAKQRIDIEKEYNNLLAELKRESARIDIESEKETVATKITIARLEYDERKAIWDRLVKEHRASIGQEYDDLKDTESKMAQLSIDLYNDELRNDKLSAIEKLRINDEILIAKAKLNAKLEELDNKRVSEEKKAADQASKPWRDAADQISSAFSSSMDQMLRGQVTFAQAMMQMTGRLIEDELAADAKYVAQRAVFSSMGWQMDERNAQGGLLTHLFVEQAKTNNTSIQTGVRGGITATGTAAANIEKGSEVPVALSVEAAKTGGVAAGEAARTGIKATATATGLGMDVIAGIKDIMISAWRAAAGAYAAIASIPYVGPVLAPAAAAGALAAVVGFARSVSAEGGWAEVPADGSMATLHKQEMVLPASIATPLRQMIANGPSSNSDVMSSSSASSSSVTATNSSSFNVTINAIDTQSGAAFIKKNAKSIVNALQSQVRNGAKVTA